MTAPRTLTDEEIYELAPSEREEYFRAREEAGIDDGGLTGWFERWMAHGRAQEQAQEAGDERVRELASSDVQYVGGLQPSNADYYGDDHEKMKTYVTANLDPETVTSISDAYHELHQTFRGFADLLKDAVGKSQSEWEGAAADQAHGYFSSLSEWADGNSQNAQLASEVMFQQAEAAVRAKNSMPEPVPFSWDTEMRSWGENPFNLVENVNNSIETYRRSQEAHSEAAAVMTKYDGELYTAASKQPVFAEPPKFGEGSSGEAGGPVPAVRQPGGGEGTNPSGYQGGGVPGGSVPGGGGGAGSFASGSTPGGSGSLPGGSTTGVGPMPGGTRPSGSRSPSIPRSRVPGGGGGGNTPGIGGMPMPGMVPGGAGGAGGGAGGGFGRGAGGFGPGGGAGGGSGAGPGAASGAGARPGAVPGGAAPGGAGAAAAAGRGGMGAAPMGAGAGRGGKGGEDDEHQRPTYLVEGDPDEVFGTNERTAPPVIGE